MRRILPLIAACLLLQTCVNGRTGFVTPPGVVEVAFSLAADMRDYAGDNPDYFRGACEAIAEGGAGSFMISPGDIDPPALVHDTIRSYVGEGYPWIPVVGNHEAETPSDMDWIRSFNQNNLPPLVSQGPPGGEETSYSFDRGDVHFVILNEYYDGSSDTGTDGDVVPSLLSWLEQDLIANDKPIILVFGHEPAYPLPDAESGRLRHEYDSLNKYPQNRDDFWSLLESYGVAAYICGHTHNYSAALFGTVWQIDVGHARGTGDTGSKSTFVMMYVTEDGAVWYYTYRLSSFGYALTESGRVS
jgi:hypothetical protein